MTAQAALDELRARLEARRDTYRRSGAVASQAGRHEEAQAYQTWAASMSEALVQLWEVEHKVQGMLLHQSKGEA